MRVRMVALLRSILISCTWSITTGGPISADSADLERTSSWALQPRAVRMTSRRVMVIDIGISPSPSICTREPERNQGASHSAAPAGMGTGEMPATGTASVDWAAWAAGSDTCECAPFATASRLKQRQDIRAVFIVVS
ncbi:hypothetical protein D3C81_1453850 [compost metagenome]